MNLPAAVDGDADPMLQESVAFLKSPERRRRWREFYRLAHAAPPVYLGHDEWLIAGRDDVLAAMRDEGAELTARYPTTLSPELNELFLGMLPFESGAEHRRLRALTQPLFSAATMARLQVHVAALMDELLYPAAFRPEGCDVLGTLGVRVPELMSGLLLDAAPAERPAIGQWARLMYGQLGRYDQDEAEIRESEAACLNLRAYVRRRIAGEGEEKCSGIGAALVEARHRGELSDEQLTCYFALFLFTGLDTLTYAIGNSLWFLGNSPELFAALRRSPELVDIAFAETMRLWGPIRLCVRQLQRPVRLGGVNLPEGSTVFLLVHAANRDARRLERCDELLLQRRRGEDLAFGVGPHGCLGTAVGKLVGRTLFRSVVANCASLRATPGLDDPPFIASQPILGIQSVRLFAQPDPGRAG